MRMIWATRGRTWGFRFLRRGGLDDPLPTYSAAFDGFDGVEQLWTRSGKLTALRFGDPLGRKDRAGRLIPHDFVILGDPSTEINSVSSGIELVWQLVAADYARDYDLPQPLENES